MIRICILRFLLLCSFIDLFIYFAVVADGGGGGGSVCVCVCVCVCMCITEYLSGVYACMCACVCVCVCVRAQHVCAWYILTWG